MRTLNPSDMAYQDYRRLMSSYHEAGHAVAAHVLGWTFLDVQVEDAGGGKVRYDPLPRQEPWLGEDRAEKARRVELLRAATAIYAAGPAANIINQRAVERRGYANRAESRAYSNYWAIPISIRYGSTMADDDPVSDYACVVRDARSICLAFKPGPRAKLNSDGIWELFPPRKSKPVTDEQVVAEIVRAEKAAERLLKEHWAAVEDIATAVYKSKSGRLYRRHLLARMERHGVVPRQSLEQGRARLSRGSAAKLFLLNGFRRPSD
jgi:hypothetical protein